MRGTILLVVAARCLGPDVRTEPEIAASPPEVPAGLALVSPPYAFTHTLVDGAMATGVGGVRLKATLSTPPGAGRLEQTGCLADCSLRVWIHPVTPPVPLDPRLKPIGEYFSIGAERSFYARAQLELPVPPSVDPDHLAVAMLIPADLVLDLGRDGWVWEDQAGIPNADRQTLTTWISRFDDRGVIYVLVEVPEAP